jgi:hypothetical protein
MAIVLSDGCQLTRNYTSLVYTLTARAKLTADTCCRLYAMTAHALGDILTITNGVASLQIDGTTITASVPADNAWHHIALVRSSASALALYVDGAVVATSSVALSNLPLNMGAYALPGKTTEISGFMFFERAFTATEVATQAATYYPISPTFAWWPFVLAGSYLLRDFTGANDANALTATYSYSADPATPAADPPMAPPDPTVAPAAAASYTPASQTITLAGATDLAAIWIDLEDATGAKLGSGPLQALAYTSTARMDAAGKFSCIIAANDPQVDQVAKRRILRAWTAINGQIEEIGAGIIDSITTTIGADGAVLLVLAGDDLIRELAWRSMQGQRLAYQSAGAWQPVTHAQAITLLDYYTPPGWVLYAAPAPAIDSVYGAFVGESVLQAASAVARLTRTHFYRGAGRSLIYASSFTDSGIAAIQPAGALMPAQCAISELQIESQSYDLIARLYPFGAGQAAARLTMAATTRTAPAGYVLSTELGYIEHSATAASYGLSIAYVQWPDIAPLSNTDADLLAASNALYDVALEYLRDRTERSQPIYRLTLAQCSKLLRPLQTIRVSYLDPQRGINVDQTLNVLEATITVDAAGARTTSVVVSAGELWPENDTATMARSIQAGKLYQAHPQLNANSYVLAYSKALDEDQANPAIFRFRFDSEVTQISRVTFDFQLLPLESTVKTVAGASATTVASADHTHTITVASHTHNVTVAAHSHNVTIAAHSHNVTVASHTHSVPNHTHYITITGGNSPTYPIGYGAAGTAGGLYHNASGSNHNYPTNSNSGAVTSATGGSINQSSADGGSVNQSSADGGSINQSSAGGGAINQSSAGGGAHTHTVTPVITTTYGVFRDSAGNTFVLADLEYSLDAATWYGFAVGVNGFASLGDSWYRVDLTELVQAVDSYRPRSANNALRIRRKTAGATGKKATIDAQLNVRTIIQALALT